MIKKYIFSSLLLLASISFFAMPHTAKAWPVSIKTLVITDSANYSSAVTDTSGSAAPVSFMSNSTNVFSGKYCSKAKCDATPGCNSGTPNTSAAAFVHGTSGVTDNNFFNLNFYPSNPGYLCFGGSKYCGLVNLDYGATTDGYGFNCACKLSSDPAGYSTFQESIDLTGTGYAIEYVHWYSNAITDCAGQPVNHYSYQDTSVCTSTYPKIAITQNGDKYSWDTAGANGYYTWIFINIKPKPTCNLSVTNNGGTIGLNWTTQNSTSASIDNGVGSATPLGSGSKTGITTPAVATTYTMTVHNQLSYSWSKDISSTCTVTLNPISNSCPILSATPNSVRQGDPTKLAWGGGANVQSFDVKQQIGSGTPTSVYANAQNISSSNLDVVPSVTTNYLLDVLFADGTRNPDCTLVKVPVTVRPYQSGSDRDVPPN